MTKKTLLLLVMAIFSIGTSKAQESSEIVFTDMWIENYTDNYNVSVYFPYFEAGESAELLREKTFEIFNEYNLNKDTLVVDSRETLYAMIEANGRKLAQVGLTKSIDEIDYVHVSTWSFFKNAYICSLFIDQYAEIGIALPIVRSHAVNINRKTGEIFNPKDLIIDTLAFMDIAAEIYCKDHRLPKNALRGQTGLNYDIKHLPVAKVMAFTNEGLELYYNRGEIAPISKPSISILVPYGKMKQLLPEDFFDVKYVNSSGKHETEKIVKSIAKKNDKYARKQNNKLRFRQF